MNPINSINPDIFIKITANSGINDLYKFISLNKYYSHIIISNFDKYILYLSNRDKHSLLKYASQYNLIYMVKPLLRYLDKLKFCLYLATKYNNIEIVKILLNHCDVENDEWFPIILITIKQNYIKLFKFFITNYDFPLDDNKNYYIRTAIEYGHFKIVQILLDNQQPRLNKKLIDSLKLIALQYKRFLIIKLLDLYSIKYHNNK